MIKNTLSVLIFLIIMLFFFLIFNTYFSNNQQKKINKNRSIISKKIQNNIYELPVLINDTYNVIKFNSGFENENNKIERNFWKLFKKND